MQKPLYEVKIITDFAAAHNLRNFRGKCENLHGHNWKVEIAVHGHHLDESGVLVDFGEIKQITRSLLADLDHRYLNDLAFFKDRNPSSENIALYLFQRLSEHFKGKDYWLHKVSAWESADACATIINSELK